VETWLCLEAALAAGFLVAVPLAAAFLEDFPIRQLKSRVSFSDQGSPFPVFLIPVFGDNLPFTQIRAADPGAWRFTARDF
jgi:hypothetical protein